MIRSPNNTITPTIYYAAAGRTTAQTGATLDCQGYDFAVFLINLGVLTDTGALVFVLQESADASSWAEVTGGGYTVIEASDDNTLKVIQVRLNARLRYLRLNTTVSNTDSMVYGCEALRIGMDRQVDQNPSASYTVTV